MLTSKMYLARRNVMLKIYSEKNIQAKTIELKDGTYNKNVYISLLISDGTVMLEGDDITILETNAKYVVIEPESVSTALGRLLGYKIHHCERIEEVPEGKERELLAALLDCK